MTRQKESRKRKRDKKKKNPLLQREKPEEKRKPTELSKLFRGTPSPHSCYMRSAIDVMYHAVIAIVRRRNVLSGVSLVGSSLSVSASGGTPPGSSGVSPRIPGTLRLLRGFVPTSVYMHHHCQPVFISGRSPCLQPLVRIFVAPVRMAMARPRRCLSARLLSAFAVICWRGCCPPLLQFVSAATTRGRRTGTFVALLPPCLVLPYLILPCLVLPCLLLPAAGKPVLLENRFLSFWEAGKSVPFP